jgi:hypothetical protein
MPHTSALNAPRLLAISDLHVGCPENREFIENLRPEAEGDWLLLAGDVGELFADVEWAQDGVRFVEASVSYPREWGRRPAFPGVPEPGAARQILPVPAYDLQRQSGRP